eukprot:1504679-Pyramimonas_sp.AAC.1
MDDSLFAVYEDTNIYSDDDDYIILFVEKEFYDGNSYASCLRGVAGDDGATWYEGPGVRRAANLTHLAAYLAKAASGMDV